MLAKIRQLFAPPVFEDDEDKTRIARLLNTILWLNLVVWLAIAMAIPLLADPLTGGLILGAMILLALAALVLMHRRYVRQAGGLLSLSLWSVVTVLILLSGGVSSPWAAGYIVVMIMAGLLISGRAAIAFAGLTIVVAMGLFFAELSGLLPRPLLPVNPILGLVAVIGNTVIAVALLYVTVRSLNHALGRARRYAAALEEQREYLGEAVAERTRHLIRRTRSREATAAIARDAVSVLDLQDLLSRVVHLISEQFGFYHTGIFLLDPGSNALVLEAASSDGGQRMMARGHQVEAGMGIVGSVAVNGTPRIALDAGADAVFFDNPDLPDTRSEMALPMQARGEIFGVLDVQSTEAEAFGEEDVAVLQTLADQVALAISNARLFQRVQDSRETERRVYGELTSEAWRELIQVRPDLGFQSDERGTVTAGTLWEPHMARAVRTGEVTSGEQDASALSLPIKVRDQVIGVIDGRKPDGTGAWTTDEIELLEAMAEQLNVALEGARLYHDSQRRAVRERILGQITSRMRQTLDVDTVLRTAVQEMREALDIAEVEVHLDVTTTRDGDGM